MKRKKAFTLVEILVVIAIIGILFMFFVPRIDFAGNKARETGVKSDLRSFMLATEQVMCEQCHQAIMELKGKERITKIKSIKIYKNT